MTATTVDLPEVKKNSYITGIDSLRAVAVVSVILYHLNDKWLPGGFVGVDMFFAISGYLITKTLLERPASNGIRFFLGFYRRRLQRIAPALFFYLAITSALTAYFVPRSFLGQGSFRTAKWAVIGASNIQLVMSSDGYFGDRMPYNPFVQTWSLGVEEQFYLIYPIILLLISIAFYRKNRQLEIIGKLTLILATVISFVVCVQQTSADPLRSFYLLPARFWELAAGALLYILVSRNPKHYLNKPALAPGLFLSGLALIIVSLACANVVTFPFWWAIPVVVGALALIQVASNLDHPSLARIAPLFTNKRVVFIGKISYSLYLWHWGIFVLMRWTIGIESLWTKALALGLTFFASWFSYRWIETPPRRSAWVKKRSDVSVVVAGLVAGALCFQLVVAVSSWATVHNSKATLPWFRDNIAIAKMLNSIEKTSVGRGHKVVFVGDSHAGHYKNVAQWTAAKTGSKKVMIRQYGCGFVNLMHAAPSNCVGDDYFINKIEEATSPGDIVVLSSFSLPRIAELWGPLDKKALLADVEGKQASQARADVLASSVGVVKRLQAMGLTVVLAAPTQVFETPPDRCHRWFNRHNPACVSGFKTDRTYQLQLRAPVMKSYRSLSAQTGAILWDPFNLLCPADPCRSEVNGRFLYLDQHHLSPNGNIVVFRDFLNLARQIWQKN
ncbi:MAG: acyltransferase family protein [Actinomycetes bacterium]